MIRRSADEPFDKFRQFSQRLEDISFLEIMNPIVLGQAIDDKEFILDVKITMNNNTIIDLELQVINYHNWPDRSLQYLCRVFNSLKQGQDYDETIAVIHIGILDFDLFPEESRREAEENRKEAEKNRKEAEESRKRAEDAEAELLRLRELLRKSDMDTELNKK